jgi:hypothetical protein
MTLIVALVRADCALIASDTRVQLYGRSGLQGHQDGASKLRHYTEAWSAGSIQPRELSVFGDGTLSCEDMRARLRDLAPAVRGRVGEWKHYGVPQSTAAAFLVRRDPDGLVLYVADFMQGRLERAVRWGMDASVPIADPDIRPAIYDRVGAARPILFEAPAYRLLALLSELYVDVRELCGPDGSVSDDMEVGVLRLEGDRVVQEHIAPTRAVEVGC